VTAGRGFRHGNATVLRLRPGAVTQRLLVIDEVAVIVGGGVVLLLLLRGDVIGVITTEARTDDAGLKEVLRLQAERLLCSEAWSIAAAAAAG
jgi:hypothetical protein